MIITAKRKLTSSVAILCAIMILMGIFPMNLFSKNVEAATADDLYTVNATLYDYFTDEEIAGQSITTSAAGGFTDPYTIFNNTISGGNLITVYFDNPNNWLKTRVYTFDSNGREFTGAYSKDGNPDGYPGTLMYACNKTYNGTKYKFCYTFPTGSVSSNISVIFIGADENGYVYEQYNQKPDMSSYRFAFRNNIQVGKINYCKGTSCIKDPNNKTISDTPTAYVDDPSLKKEGLNLTYPLYFGSFYWGEKSTDYTANNKPLYNNFYWAANIVQRNDTSSSIRGLVNQSLGSNGELKDINGNTQLPYFNAEFLNSNNIGTSYDNVDFTFKKKTDSSYYYFDSEDPNFGYYYNKTENKVYTGSSYAVYNNLANSGYGFFPFDSTNTGTQYSDPHLNMGFGMNFNIDFTLPRVNNLANVKDDSGKDIIFSFRGDDDVWVYLDNKLALDLGGAHGRSGGAINFTERKVRLYNSIDFESINKDEIKGKADTTKLSNTSNQDLSKGISKGIYRTSTLGTEKDAGYIQWNVSGSESTAVSYVEYTFDELGIGTIGSTVGDNGYITGYDGETKHSIQFFYMERGMFESNLYASFNFATIPNENTLTIKETTDFSGVNAGLLSQTKKVADSDVFNYTVANKGTETADITTSGIKTPTYTYIERKNTDASGTPQALLSGITPTTTTVDDTTHVYLRTSSFTYTDTGGTKTGSWSEANAIIAAWIWGDGINGHIVNAEKVSDNFYRFDVDGCKGIHFFRLNPSNTYTSTSYPTDPWGKIVAEDITNYKGKVMTTTGWNAGTWGNEVQQITTTDEVYETNNFNPNTAETITHDGVDYKAVSNVSYKWTDPFAVLQSDGTTPQTSLTNNTGDNGSLNLMYNDSAQFIGQFARYTTDKQSTMYVVQNGELRRPGRNLSTVETFADKSGRNVSTYYTTTVTAVDKNNNTLDEYSTAQTTGIPYKYANTNDDPVVQIKQTFTNKVKTGSIEITKNLADGSEPSDNFTFKVTFSNLFGSIDEDVTNYSNIVITGITQTTLNADGTFNMKANETAIISGIPVGTDFTVTEENTSDNYNLKEYKVNGTIKDSVSEKITATSKSFKVEVTNERKTGSLTLNKELKAETGATITDSDNAQKFTFTVTLESTDFDLDPYYTTTATNKISPNGWTKVDDNSKKITKTFEVSKNNSVEITNIPYGTSYTVTEDTVPSGWTKITTYDITGTITSATPSATATITNQKQAPQKATLVIQKYDNADKDKADTDKVGLSGAKFQLYDAGTGGNKVGAELTTDSNGKATFTGLVPNKTYWIEEVQAPAGYQKLLSRISVTTGKAGSTVTKELYNAQIVMPSAGGEGKDPFNFVLFGAIAIALAGGILLLNKKYAFLHKGKSSKEVQ